MSKFNNPHYLLPLIFGLSAFTVYVSSTTAAEKLTVDLVLSVEADRDYGEYLAGECMTCHNGQDTNIPVIKGKERVYIVDALIEYKDLTRSNETMRSIAGSMGKDEIAALAAYYSDLSE